MFKRLDLRLAGYLLLMSMLVWACGTNTTAGVNVKSINTDLVFGIPPLDEPVAPGGLEQDDMAGFEVRTAPKRPRPSPSPKVKVDCPNADPNQFAPDTPLEVQGKPPIGNYLWKVTGPTGEAEDSKPLGYNRNQGPGDRDLEKYTDRQVTSIQEFSNEAERDFEYVVLLSEPFPGGDEVQQRYEVDLNTGIYLTEIVRQPGTSSEAGFVLEPRLKILPLPVVFGPAGKIEGRAVNAEGGMDVLSLSGQTLSRQPRVDACGALIAGIAVDAHMEYTFQRNKVQVLPNGYVVTTRETVTEVSDYHYYISTKMGGLVIFEHFETPPCSTKANDEETVPDEEKEERDPATGRCKYRNDPPNANTPDRPYREFNVNIGQLTPGPMPSPST